MSNYFKNFPMVDYRFGDNEEPVEFQHIGTYIDAVDQVKEYSIYYEAYTIQDGQRPDQISSTLYGTPNNYWTFWLLNDSLRTGGWPLSDHEVFSKSKEYYPNISFVTDGVTSALEEYISYDTSGEISVSWIESGIETQLCADDWFKVGNYIYFRNSRSSGKILAINQDLGIITTDAKNVFFRSDDIVEVIDKESALKIMTDKEYEPLYKYSKMYITKIYNQHEAPHHYENFVTKEWIKPKLSSEAPFPIIQNMSTIESISNYENLVNTNVAQKTISVIKKDVITTVVGKFNELLKESR